MLTKSLLLLRNLQKFIISRSEWIISIAVAVLIFGATVASANMIANGREAKLMKAVLTREVARLELSETANSVEVQAQPEIISGAAVTSGQVVASTNNATSSKTTKLTKTTKATPAKSSDTHVLPILPPSRVEPATFRPETYGLRETAKPLVCEKVVLNYDENLEKIEVNQKVLVTLKSNLFMVRPDSWSGAGIFEKGADSSVRWHSDTPGKFEITVTGSQHDSSCTLSRTIEVLPLMQRLEGLNSISIGKEVSSYINQIDNLSYLNYDIDFLNSENTTLQYTTRFYTMPLKVKLEVESYYGSYKDIYTKTFTDDSVLGIFPLYSPTRDIRIAVKDMNLDYDNLYPEYDGSIRILSRITVSTPEQGDFVTEAYGYIYKQ